MRKRHRCESDVGVNETPAIKMLLVMLFLSVSVQIQENERKI